MKIGLMADSTCDLSKVILERYNIKLVPLSIHFGETVYLDRVELGSEEFFAKLENSEELPTTSQPPIGIFVKKYEEMAAEYDAIISIHLSEKFSGTGKAARMAATQFDDLDIRVIDSRSVSLGTGYLVLLAARLISSGYGPDEIVEKIEKARDNIFIYFTVNDLSYLQKGGRIGKAQAFLGSILNVYPVLSLPGNSGEILPLEKARGKKKIIKRLVELAMEELEGVNNAWLGLIHGTNLDVFNIFKEMLKNRLSEKESFEYRMDVKWISSVLGCHVGPSVYGIVIFKGDFLK